MSKSNKPRAQKEKIIKIQLLNLKLFSNSRQNENGYSQLLEDIFKQKVVKQVGSTDYMIIRTFFKTKWKKHIIIYGKISKFTKIESDEWFNINNMEMENFEVPKDRFPNLRETDYIFYPYAHRLAIVKSSKVGIISCYKYFKQALNDVITNLEKYEVNIEQSSDVFKDIIAAQTIHRLEIEISYTNADINNYATKYMDDELKAMNAGKYKVIITPNQNNSLEIENSEVLKGTLGIAQSDGEVKASITDEEGNNKIIMTKDHPRTEEIKIKGDSFIETIAENINKLFRSGRKKI